MALLHTPGAQNNFQAPDFRLKNIDGRMISLAEIKGDKGFVLAFISNHCPYVKAIIERFVRDAAGLRALGFGVAAIMPNDTRAYPDDSFENMKKFSETHGFSFPYLIDETQETARAYDAVCTPDLFGFDAGGVLQYRGRLDSAGPHPADGATVRELYEAMRMLAETGVVPTQQFPSMGCSIKWR
ncbi:MAG: thioredoxin family protein [Alphaproteobacteria bacterium]|nr:thioredoxin family protein [Alphaproteobacteria bacterium]